MRERFGHTGGNPAPDQPRRSPDTAPNLIYSVQDAFLREVNMGVNCERMRTGSTSPLEPLLWVALAFAWVGCGKDSGGGGGNANDNQQRPCPAATRAEGLACVPIFDDCPAADEIPVLGGGCLAIGVERCSYGSGCADGFSGDGAGGCEPLRPAAECGAGQIQLLGQSACEPVRACGPAPWGDGPFDPGAVYVDAAYSGGASDGTPSAPFITISEGVATAPAGGQVVVAAGTYPESVTLDRRLHLLGRCPEQVHIQGQLSGGQPAPALTISSSAAGTVVQGVHLTGPGPGVVLNEVEDVALREVEVTDTGSYGLMLQRGSTASLHRVKVARAQVAGVLLYGGSITAVSTVVRDTAPSTDGSFGRGLDLGCDHIGGGGCPSLDATALVVERNREAGIMLSGGEAILRRSLVADTLANAGTGQAGIGIHCQCDTTSADCPSLTIRGSVVESNRAAGIMALGTNLVVEDTVIRGTLPQEADGRFGTGLVSLCDPSLSRCEPLSITCAVLEDNHQTGLSLAGVTGQVRGALIRDTAEQMSDSRGGEGLVVGCEQITRQCADLALLDSGIWRSTFGSVFVHGSRLAANGAYMAGARPGAESQTEGFGLYAQCDSATGSCPEVTLDGCLLEDHVTEGVALFGGTTQLTRSSVLGVSPQQSDSEFGVGVYVDGQVATLTPTLDASSCEISDATLAGLFWVQAAGSLERCLVQGAEYSVILHQSAEGVSLDPWNELSGTTQSDPLVQQ